jgi:hypothetical protein
MSKTSNSLKVKTLKEWLEDIKKYSKRKRPKPKKED